MRQALEQYAAGTTSLGASEMISPVARYLHPGRFALELEKILRRMPAPVADALLAAFNEWVESCLAD